MKQKVSSIGCILLLALWGALTLGAWFASPKAVSESERRPLAQFPAFDLQKPGEFIGKFEDFSLDQFPLRDSFRRLKSLFHYNVLNQKDNNNIYLADGFAAKMEYPLNTASVNRALGKFQKIYETCLKGNCENIVFAVVPDKGYYLAQPNGYLSMDYETLFSMVQGLEWAQFVDLTELLRPEDYYRTDTHWRQEKIQSVAQALLTALGREPGEENYTPVNLERPFYGVYYGQAALPMEPETMTILTSDTLEDCIVTNLETGKAAGIYDMAKLTSPDLYDVYLSGAVSLMTIDNPNAPDQKELIVFRDSFGSSLVPLLAQSYSRITLVDIRYVSSQMLDSFLTFDNQDVLFLYSTLILNNSATLK